MACQPRGQTEDEGGERDGYATLEGSKVLCSYCQCRVHSWDGSQTWGLWAGDLGQMTYALDLIFMPLKSEKGGHKA